ncbi:MAG: secretion system protein [Candidatus Rokuibacteriota bacterium]|nr:MAG: secretion system protein [Candidatus Rokubacteria bacterium]
MFLVLLIGLALVGVACALFARTLLFPRTQASDSLRQIDAYGFASTQSDAASQPSSSPRGLPDLNLRRFVDRSANRVGGALMGRSKSLSEDRLRGLLRSAGYYTLSPGRFVGYQVLLTLTVVGLWIWYALAANPSPLISVLGAIIALLAGWSLPTTFLKRRARQRGQRIDYEMPDLIDTLVATVEAGIAFSGSLQIAGRRFRGPLGEELRLTLQEQSMGLGLNGALNNMLERQNTPGMRSFVRSLIQGEQLGVSIGQTLRNLSHDMRTLRRQMAEEKAQKAPVKLIFPLVLFILPALFVVVLGPAVLRIHAIFHP